MRLQQIVSAENLAKRGARARELTGRGQTQTAGRRFDRMEGTARGTRGRAAKKHRREGKGPCLTDAARLTFSRRAVRVVCRYAIVRTDTIALRGSSAEVASSNLLCSWFHAICRFGRHRRCSPDRRALSSWITADHALEHVRKREVQRAGDHHRRRQGQHPRHGDVADRRPLQPRSVGRHGAGDAG
jgi:hypothetical protein